MPIRFWRPVLKHCCDIRLPFKRKRQQSFATMFSLGKQSRRGVLRNRSFSQHDCRCPNAVDTCRIFLFQYSSLIREERFESLKQPGNRPHSSADKPAVEELARRLAKEGLEAWLDKWHLIPGNPWQPAIEKALAESETC